MTKTLQIAGLAIALSLVSATAFAADHNRGDRNRGDHNRGPAVSQQDNDHRFDGRRHRNANFKVTQPQQHNWQPQVHQQKNWQNNNWKNGNNGNWNNNNWNNNNNKWRNNDFNRYRSNQFAQKRFRAGSYHAPRGYNYRRFSYGDRLPFLYLSSNFWLTNALGYGLFQAPPGLIWVRYGDDALLVDRYTGEVVQVRYNIFY
jgi:hypothetical protein